MLIEEEGPAIQAEVDYPPVPLSLISEITSAQVLSVVCPQEMIRQVDFSWYWLIEERTHWWYNHKRISLSSFWRYALRKGVSKQLLSIVSRFQLLLCFRKPPPCTVTVLVSICTVFSEE